MVMEKQAKLDQFGYEKYLKSQESGVRSQESEAERRQKENINA
jgi:hypothetical protein